MNRNTTHRQIEERVLRLLDQLAQGSPVEDSLVEFKRSWPDEHERAARRLGGHCNASYGSEVLWIIGADESAGKVIGANRQDLASWWPQLEKWFDGVPPRLATDLVVPYRDTAVVALLFETDRAPFVMKTGRDPIQHEVPWREGTRVRSARREDLVRLLVPAGTSPDIELLAAELVYSSSTFYFSIDLYIIPRNPGGIVFPYHRTFATATITSLDEPFHFQQIKLKPAGHSGFRDGVSSLGTVVASPSGFLHASDDELVMLAAGRIEVTGQVPHPGAEVLEGESGTLALSLDPIPALPSLRIACNLKPGKQDKQRSSFSWQLSRRSA